MNPINKRRGMFRVSRDLVKNNPQLLMKALRDVWVIQAVFEASNDTFIYTAISEKFDPVEEAQMTPDYEVQYNEQKNETTFTKITHPTKLCSLCKKELLEEIKSLEIIGNEPG